LLLVFIRLSNHIHVFYGTCLWKRRKRRGGEEEDVILFDLLDPVPSRPHMYIFGFCVSNLPLRRGCCYLLVLVRVSLYIPQRLIEIFLEFLSSQTDY
jgi:hypothetical protein